MPEDGELLPSDFAHLPCGSWCLRLPWLLRLRDEALLWLQVGPRDGGGRVSVTLCVCGRPHPPRQVRTYVADGPGGVHYVRQDGEIVTADVAGVLDGDLDALLTARIRDRAETEGEGGR